MVIPTWKPIGTIHSQMREFYIGGSASLKDVKLSGIPPTHEVPVPCDCFDFLTRWHSGQGVEQVRFPHGERWCVTLPALRRVTRCLYAGNVHIRLNTVVSEHVPPTQ